MPPSSSLFITVIPGLEAFLRDELSDLGFQDMTLSKGGITLRGDWDAVWKINYHSRGATRVLWRVADFPVHALSQLEQKAGALDWATLLHGGTRIRVDATTSQSRLYHSGAVAERVENALRKNGYVIAGDDGALSVLVRMEKDQCTISLDTSGQPLHRRGFKQAVNAAPMRETMAAMLLRACDHDPNEPVFDPMCGSGTFVLEAADIAHGLAPGRARSFAFEKLATFDGERFNQLKLKTNASAPPAHTTRPRHFGSDKDARAITSARENAKRAGLEQMIQFEAGAIARLQTPDCAPGLIMINPPYGGRLGDLARLRTLYALLGRKLKQRCAGWRIGLVTSDERLARATGLDFHHRSEAIAHGSIRIELWQARL